MIFTLEALEAKHGDALLLHYGTKRSPELIVIDGGPAGVYARSLRPRLDELREERVGDDAPLPIRMLLVSHIDDDHIHGVLDLVGDLVEADQDGTPAPFDVLSLWHNSFDDLVKKAGPAGRASASEIAGRVGAAGLDSPVAKLFPSGDGAAICVSVAQGRTLRQHGARLALRINEPFGDLVAPTGTRDRTVNLGGGLSLVVLGPRQAQLDGLQSEWAKQLAAMRKKKGGKLSPADLDAVAADFVDGSVANLSSIVVLATAGRRRMLLTGDARGDFILDGLRAAKLLQRGRCAVDVLKVPHHGSDRNVDRSFFEAIPARHYVISADGRYDNPDPRMLDYLFQARGDADYTLHMTNQVPRIARFLAGKKPPRVRVDYRDAAARSLRVDLGEPLSG